MIKGWIQNLLCYFGFHDWAISLKQRIDGGKVHVTKCANCGQEL